MSVDSIGTSGSGLVAALRDRFQAFRDGRVNISKDDLKAIKDELGSNSSAGKLYDSFDKIDLNGDGMSFGELATYAKANKSSLLGPSDLTKDQLTEMRDKIPSTDSERASILDKLIQSFSSADTNGDGKISGDEFRSFAEANRSSAKRGGPDDQEGLSKDFLSNLADKLSSTDSTSAGNLNKLVQNFGAADTNGDGKLSRDEFKAYAQANGIPIPIHHHHHGNGRGLAGADPSGGFGDHAGTSSIGTDPGSADPPPVDSSSKSENGSLLTGLIKSVLQRYSQPDAVAASLLSEGVQA